jgi:hypothetical protein
VATTVSCNYRTQTNSCATLIQRWFCSSHSHLTKVKNYKEGFEQSRVVKVAAGRDFTVLAVQNGKEQPETEIYATGINKWGQLGIGELSDFSDFTKIRPISNLSFQKQADGPSEPMQVTGLECGSDHCLCMTNMGVIFEWGANEKGQLGNRRRGFSESPLIVDAITDKKVISIAAAYNTSAALVEQTPTKTT